MKERFFKILVGVSIIFMIGWSLFLVIMLLTGTGDWYIVLAWFLAAPIPLLLISTIQYIIFNNFHPLYFFKK